MASKLVGKDDTTIDGSYNYDYFTIDRYTAVASGVCSNIRVKVSGNGNIRVAVYDVDGNRLAKKDAGTAVTAGWNTIHLEAPFNVTNGVVYGLAYITSAAVMGYDTVGGSVHYYKASDYDGFTFPNPAGSGFSLATNNTGIIAGWSIETYSETGRTQVILATGGKTTPAIFLNVANLQIILAALGEYDSMQAVYVETGKLQEILAAIGETDNAVFAELAKTQIVLVTAGESTIRVLNELARNQDIVVVQGSADLAIFDELALTQVVLAAITKSDVATWLEEAHTQVVLVVQGEQNTLIFGETASLQVILAMLGGWDFLVRHSLAGSISGGVPKFEVKHYPVKKHQIYGQEKLL